MGIQQEIGNSMNTIKADGTKDVTGLGNISIISFFNEHYLKVAERLLVLSSTDFSNVKSITDLILVELTKARLSSSKILSQVYDGTSVMAGHYGEVQHLLQERENKKIPYVRCLNNQLHHVAMRAMSVEQAIKDDVLHVCGSLYNFFRKPTVALHYNGEKLTRRLEQRWTGYLATVTTVLNSFQHMTLLLQEMGTSRAYTVKQKPVP